MLAYGKLQDKFQCWWIVIIVGNMHASLYLYTRGQTFSSIEEAKDFPASPAGTLY